MSHLLFTAILSVFMLLPSPFAFAGEAAISRATDDAQVAWGPCPPFFPAGCQLAVLHGDAAAPNADVFFKVPGKTAFPAHWHTSAERMVLVDGEMNVTYQGQETTHLKQGMYAYGPAKAVHHGECISEQACVLFIAFENPVDAFAHEGQGEH